MKTAKQLRTGLLGEGGFIPNQVTMPARELYEIHKELARLKAERDELRGALADGQKAAEGAQITMDAWCAGDPCNNDNYCRLLDWIKNARTVLAKGTDKESWPWALRQGEGQ